MHKGDEIVYRMPDRQLSLDDFYLGFNGSLDSENRWVKLARLIPWETIEKKYATLFVENNGQPAKPLRMALGALIIKEKENWSDRQTVQHIIESPYLQYFIGLSAFQKEAPFDSSLMVDFRKRLTSTILGEINEMIRPDVVPAKTEESSNSDDPKDPPPPAIVSGRGEPSSPPKHKTPVPLKGKLILDATCAPADIRFPTDLSLLNEARENLDTILDQLHEPLRGSIRRPRTYRRIARKDFLHVAKQKQPKHKAIRKSLRRQLGYVKRNLRHVDSLLAHPTHGQLTNHWSARLDIVRQLIAQQREMFQDGTHRVADRIVSLYQSHVRPIVRGKANAYCEFGAKVAISVVNGFSTIEKLSWDAFNEGNTLVASVEAYCQRYGHYPEAVLADKIYRTRENLAYCKELGIRLSGPKLGRPKQGLNVQEKRIERQDNRERNEVEGKFGEGKRRYGLNRIMARLKDTAESEIAMQFLVMNLQHRLRISLHLLWLRFLKCCEVIYWRVESGFI